MISEIIPELAPYFGDHRRLTAALGALMGDGDAQRAQVEAQAELRSRFGDRHAARRAAELIDQGLSSGSFA